MKIPALHVGRGAATGPVTLFPVWTEQEHLDDLQAGSDARVSVTEMPGGAQVPLLSIANPGPWPVLLVEGELLEGGWQTRSLAADLLLAPGATVTASVVCVEEDRWHGGAGHVRRARHASPSVRAALRGEGAVPGAGTGQPATPPQSRQHAVWDSVRRYGQASRPAAGMSLAGHLDRTGDSTSGRPRSLPGQCGVIVGIAGWPVSMEWFGSRDALAAHLPGIAAAARLDASLLHGQESATASEPVPGRRTRRFAEVIGEIPLTRHAPAAGEGIALSGRGPWTSIRGIATADGQIAHLSVLNLRHQLLRAAA